MTGFDGYIGQTFAVCERCMIRCERWYIDHGGMRSVYVICPICNNGDPQTNQEDCGLSDEELKNNLRFLLFIKGIDEDDFKSARLRALHGTVQV